VTKKRTVLFIDDNQSVLASLERGLMDEPYRTLFARSGDEALEILKDKEVHVIVTDMRMPGMSGLELLKIVKKEYPRIIRLVLSGYAQITTLLTAVNQGEIFKYITKPWKLEEEFKSVVRQAIDYYNLQDERDSLIEKLKQAHDELEKKVEERTMELKIANEQLKKHERMETEFVMTIAHELRTPMTILKNIISNILAGVTGRTSKKQRENLEIANNEMNRLAKIINDFLDISKIEAGKINLKPTRIVIQSVVANTVKFLTPLADDKSIELKTLMPEEELFVNADPDKLAQVLNNLVENAVKFTPDCGGRIVIRVKDLDTEIEVDIEDNGRGIEADDIGRVFNRFVQVEKYIGPGEHGTGLGLSITKELVELHGGQIWVENAPTGGANFCFVLPRDVSQIMTKKRFMKQASSPLR